MIHTLQTCLTTKCRINSPKFWTMNSFHTPVGAFTFLGLMYMVCIFVNCNFLQRCLTYPFGVYSYSLFIDNINTHPCFWFFINHK